MELNLLKFGFISMTFLMVIMGVLINTSEKYLPTYFVQTFRYGKFAYKGKGSFIPPIEVPKRWFQHFYIFAVFFSSLATFIMCGIYFYGAKLDSWVLVSLDLLVPKRQASVTSLSAILAVILLTIQSWHRFYETSFISVFSDARMNIVHYFVGYIHYFGSVVAILAESPGFISIEESIPQVNLSDTSLLHIVGCVLFLWSCFRQYDSSIILANLRKNPKGQIVTKKHHIPYGGWFEYVSSPHLFAEVLMYFALTCILWGASLWPWVFFWVLSNQVESALLAHWWYKSTFENYPENRKAIFPFVL